MSSNDLHFFSQCFNSISILSILSCISFKISSSVLTSDATFHQAFFLFKPETIMSFPIKMIQRAGNKEYGNTYKDGDGSVKTGWYQQLSTLRQNDNRDPTDKSIQKIMLAERGTSTVFQLIKNKYFFHIRLFTTYSTNSGINFKKCEECSRARGPNKTREAQRNNSAQDGEEDKERMAFAPRPTILVPKYYLQDPRQKPQ